MQQMKTLTTTVNAAALVVNPIEHMLLQIQNQKHVPLAIKF